MRISTMRCDVKSIVFYGILIVFGGADLVSGITKENIYGSGCNGEQIKLRCERYHKIAIKRIFYAAKRDKNCHTSKSSWPHPCCKVGHGDCLVTDDTKYSMYNVMCSGYSECSLPVEPIRAGRSCPNRTETDVLTVVYDCIAPSNIKPFCSDEKVVGKNIFLYNENYPAHIRAGEVHCKCAVKTGSTSGISVHAIDVLITRDKYGTKECLQNVTVDDGQGYAKTITCGHSGLYGYRPIFSRDVTNATLTLQSKLKEGRGYVWIQAKATDPTDILTLYCGKSLTALLKKIEASRSQVIEDENSSTTTGAVYVGGIDDKDSVDEDGKAEGGGKVDKSTAEPTSDIGAIIGGVVAALCFLFLIILIILFIQRRRKKKAKKAKENGVGFSAPIFKPKSQSSSSYCKYYYDEEHFSGIKRSPYKLSKYSDVQSETNQKLREAFISPEAIAEPDEFEQTSFGYYQVRRPIDKTTSQDDIALGLTSENRSPVEAKRKSRTLGHVTAMNGPGNSNFDRPMLGRGQNKNVPFSQPVAKVTPMHNGNDKIVEDPPDDKDITMEIIMTSKDSEDDRKDLNSPAPSNTDSEPIIVRATVQTPSTKSDDQKRCSVISVSEKRNSAALTDPVVITPTENEKCADVGRNDSLQQPVTKREKVKPPISKKPSRNVRISGPIGIDSTNVIVAAGQEKPPVILPKPSKKTPSAMHSPTKVKGASSAKPQEIPAKEMFSSKPPKKSTSPTKPLSKPTTTVGGRTSRITISNPIAVTGTNASVLNAPPVPSKDFSKCLEIKTDLDEVDCIRPSSKENSLEPDSAQNSPRRDKGHSPKRAARPRSVPPQPPLSTFRSPEKKVSPGGSDLSPRDEKGVAQPHSSDDIHGSSIEKLPTIGDFSEDIFSTLDQLQQQRHELSSSPATKPSVARV